MTAAIYTAYHKTAPLIASARVRPIHVGRALARVPLNGMIGDDTGDTISDRNGRYCELTALYWAWKNDRTSSHIGLMHYRRVLDFDGTHRTRAAESATTQFHVADYTARTEAWLDANPEVDLVVPVLHEMGRSVRANYETRHHPQDLDALEAILRRDHPGHMPHFEAVMEGRGIRLANMFYARRDIADAWCAFLFDVLDKLDRARADRRYYDTYQARYLGFVSERLFTVFVAKWMADHPATRLHEVNVIGLADALVFPYLSDGALNAPEHVNIALASDAAYVPHAAAMVASVMQHASPARIYTFFYLHSAVEPRMLEAFASVLRPHANARLHLLNVGDPFADSYRSPSRAPSNATYNRFLLFDLLPTLDRLLYIDCDMIVRGDVAEIFDVDMGTAKIAAVTDHIMTRSLTKRVGTVDPEVPDLHAYQRDRLGLTDEQIHSYFNAGLLVLNFAAMDVAATGRELRERVATSRFLFRDQDLLNSFFKDSLHRLPAKYNVMNSWASAYAFVPADNHAEAMAAKRDPFVIHYAAAAYKPWSNRAVEFAEHYWDALRQTPFYVQVLTQAMEADEGEVRRKHSILSRRYWLQSGRDLADRHPRLRPLLHRIYRLTLRMRGRRP